MKTDVRTLPEFEKNFKRLFKKYPSLKDEISELQRKLIENPELGSDLGSSLRKIRIGIKSKGKGKSGGARVITFHLVANFKESVLYLVTIYDKSEMGNLTKNEIKSILEENNMK